MRIVGKGKGSRKFALKLKPRILPLVIIVCCSYLGVKAYDILHRGQTLNEALFVSNIQAASEEEPKDDKPVEKEGATKENAPTEEKKGEEPEVKEEGEKSETEVKDEEKKTEGEHAENKEKKEEDSSEPKPAPEEEVTFTKTEIDILQRLSQRRKKLEEWEENIKVKENVLRITQTKIDQKLAELRELKGEVESLLAQYNEKEDAKIRSLVKIYENMKPKNAAEIFEQLDMDILLQVVDKMKESKSAIILANMSPERAKEITTHLAEQRKLSEPRRAK